MQINYKKEGKMILINPMKIHKKFLFTSAQIVNYLKTVKRFGSLEEELLATITYKYAYQKLLKDTLITFPYCESREIEISKRPLLVAKDIGRFIKDNKEQSSPIDSVLVDPQNHKTAHIRPLQIKFIGKGKYRDFTEGAFVRFLMQCLKYQSNPYTLVIVAEEAFKITLQNIVDWLAKENFPFEEVVFIFPNDKSGNMEFYPLKNKHADLNPLSINKEEMLKEF